MFCFKQKTAYEVRISYWSSDVCSSDLACAVRRGVVDQQPAGQQVVTGKDQSGPVVMEDHLPGMMSRRGHHAYFPVAQVHAAGARPCIEAEEIGRASCGDRVCPYV